MSQKHEYLHDILGRCIAGVIDGSINPKQAQAVCGLSNQMIKVAEFGLQSGIIEKAPLMLIPLANKGIAEQAVEESIDEVDDSIFKLVLSQPEISLKEISEALDLNFETVCYLVSKSDQFIVNGNTVKLKN